MKDKDRPILSIAIPTYNRVRFLHKNLMRLKSEMSNIDERIEVLVLDNASSDGTELMVESFISTGFFLHYIRNSKNIGPEKNIAKCFDCSTGKVLLVLGDDDLLVKGALKQLLSLLHKKSFGIICIRTFGYNYDPESERPPARIYFQKFNNHSKFLAKVGARITSISSCVINKDVLTGVRAKDYISGGNLSHVHLVMMAILAGRKNFLLNGFLIACKRNNSGGYDFSEVFVEELFKIVVSKVGDYRSQLVKSYFIKLILSYYPYYIYKLRLRGNLLHENFIRRFFDHFAELAIFHIWLRPILTWPKPIALVYGAIVVFLGRVFDGDLNRGVWFVHSRIARCLKRIGIQLSD